MRLFLFLRYRLPGLEHAPGEHLLYSRLSARTRLPFCQMCKVVLLSALQTIKLSLIEWPAKVMQKENKLRLVLLLLNIKEK